MKNKRGKHKNIPKEIRSQIQNLEKQKEVKKIILGRIECARHKYAPGSLKYSGKFKDGDKVMGYTGNGVIDIFIYSDSTEFVREFLQI